MSLGPPSGGHAPTPTQAFERARRRHRKDRDALTSLDRRAAGSPLSPSPARSTTKPGVITGYPIVYGQETVISGLFREIIAPGATTRLLGTEDVRALLNHDKNRLLGRTTNGTLTLTEDAQGVRMRVQLPPTATAAEVFELTKRGDLSSGSFAFWPKRESWYPPDRSGLPLVVVEELERLYDVSVVTYPAYKETTIGVGLTDVRDTERTLAGRMRLQELRMRHGQGNPIPPASIRRHFTESVKRRQHTFALEAE